MTDTSWREAAARWIVRDPNPETKAQVQAWLQADDDQALQEAFDGSLSFGTGGLRGPMGPGTTRMNRLGMRRTAVAWVETLREVAPDLAERGVALSYDGRRNSRVFAEDVARVIAARGVPVHLATEMTPTPVLGFAIRHLGCAAGAIVTASHNPAADNGFKVFDADGAQILSPFDQQVAQRLAEVDDPGPLADLDDARIVAWPEDVPEAYHVAVQGLRVRKAPGTLRIAYTPMHGVGGGWTPEALARAGHTDVHAVPSQIAPDGSFPTVSFPNPEEPGALDALVAHAEDVGATLALANDPDADRLAVVVLHHGAWVTLSGNEVGALLGEELLSHPTGPDPLVATTIVSTELLSRIAAFHGAACVETLTGFKWIAAKALAHAKAGGTFVLGMEESIGYTIGSLVRDKDGVSAAVVVADLAAALAAQGRTLVDALEALFARHGRHVARTVSLRMPGAEGRSRIEAAMQALRADPPWTLGGQAVAEVTDVQAGTVTDRDGVVLPVDLPASNVMGFRLRDGGRAWVRPSGTEPKIKFYAEVVVQGAASEGEDRLDALIAALTGACGLADG